MINLKEIEVAAKYIKEGKLVAFPTETVYGLGANALNSLAVAKIFEIKQRPSFDPLIVHIAHKDDIFQLSTSNDDRIIKLIDKFWPGPLTIVLPKSNIIPDIVTSGLQTVAIRMPANQIALELIKLSECPIAAPSANKFGRVSPTTANHVKKQLPNVDFIIDGGKTNIGIESTIIKLTQKGFKILRNGFITKEDLEKILPYDYEDTNESTNSSIIAPGMLKSHYSPLKKLIILNDNIVNKLDKSITGLIAFSEKYINNFSKTIRLTESNNLIEYASKMFETLHLLEDDHEVEIIAVEPVPEKGIGIAIMERLRKAQNYNI